MRWWQWLIAIVVVAGIGGGVFMLRPVNGPARDLTLVGDAGRGAYLLRLGDCISCHTDAENAGAQLAGGAAMRTAFGTFHAPNITSHPTAGIGNWTLAEFSRAMSDGEGPQGHLYPVFPYDSYTLMSDQEIADLYAALKDIPPSDNVAPAHQLIFPFSIRLALAGWKNLFFSPGRYVPEPGRSEQWNRGRYLALGPAHCASCHSPRNALGALEAGKEFAGNSAGGPGGRAPAITREALLAEGYDVPLLVEALKTGFTPNFDVLGGPMGEVIRDGTAHWTDADLEALAAYLLGEG